LLQRARSLLDADDVRDLGQSGQGFRLKIRSRPSGDVVDHDRDRDLFRDGPIMSIETFLGRAVVIGADHQRRIRPGFPGMFRQTDSLRRAVGTGSGNHRHPFVDRLHRHLDHPVMLFMGKGRRFTRRATGRNAVRPVGDLLIDQAAQRLLIDFPILERRHDSNNSASDHKASL